MEWLHAALLGILAKLREKRLKVETQFHCFRPWSDKVRSAKRGKEIEERFLVRQINHGKAQTPLKAIAVKQVIVSQASVK